MENNTNQSQSSEQPYRRRSRRRKNGGCAGTVVYVIAVLGISIVLSLVTIFVANDVFAFVAEDANVPFTVSQNAQIADLSEQLDNAGVLHYGSVFKLFVNITGKNQSVLAGDYMLNPKMDYTQVIRALTQSESKDTITITVPEGYSVEQIKKLLLDNHVCTEDAADKALNEYSFKHTFLEDEKPAKEGWLEGYLFPDTYEIYKGNSTVVSTINKMLNNFDEKFTDEMQEKADEMNRSMRDIITIASLIEREAQKDDEYDRIAGVIYNRLNNADAFPFLQVDAAVLYGLGRTSGELSKADLEKDTPYNTYTQRGLPPGPICNPGMKSIQAALNPEENDYCYYVAMPDGSHLFATSNDEQNDNIARANAAFAEAAQKTGE
ncbi:endolytic transglycosylase MltG [Butyricicoccus sp. Marseille-Q5471]|uniref:endolytic transglycosylase MltG n=1 Tax=Butyricicoccus sp. Marseille-Q5471 TaxID=3039493 RepID=UPI0024BD3245|nr:endolytic transglycosylase MltG [Butyricicoccus sp. Marseille-Q5471]